jgi:holo-[acyl-carrier protein] synthase
MYIGTDILNIDRIKSLNDINKFANRVLSKKEIEIFNIKNTQNKISYLAKRFCAKEAIYKAYSKLDKSITNFRLMSILNNKNGEPYVEINNKVANEIKISISDEKNYCIAFCIVSLSL